MDCSTTRGRATKTRFRAALAAVLKKPPQGLHAFLREQPFRDFNLVVEQIRVRETELTAYGTEAEITSSKHQS